MEELNKRYQSEERLRQQLNQQHAPLDNKAFEGFQAMLDDQETKGLGKSTNSGNWWKVISLISILALISTGIWLSKQEANSSRFTNLASEKSEEIGKSNLNKKEEIQSTKQVEITEVNEVVTEHQTVEGRTVQNQVEESSRTDRSEKGIASKDSNLNTTNQSNSLNKNSQIVSKTKLNLSDGSSQLNKRSDINAFAQSDQITKPKTSLDASETFLAPTTNRTAISLSQIEGLNWSILAIDERPEFVIAPIEVEWKKEKYPSYFYAGLDLGIKYDLNEAPENPYFQRVSRRDNPFSLEGHVRLIGGFQWKKNLGFELSYESHDVNVRFSSRFGSYESNAGYEAGYFTGRIRNRIFLAEEGLSIGTSLGYKLNVSSTRDFTFNSEGNFNAIDPITGEEAESVVWSSNGSKISNGLSTMVEFGADLNFRTSDKMEFVLSSTYAFGNKDLLHREVEYITGEGIPGEFEVTSKGSYFSFDIGLRYRFIQK